jgi:hypothetical protein
MVNACLYLLRTGCGWRYLPTDFGPWETVRTWYDRFRADGIWADIAAPLTRLVRQERGRQAEPKTAILDSQSVVSGPQKGVRGVDGNKMVKGIKRHILTCSLGFVLGVLVTPANVHDTQAAGPLLDRVAQDGWAPERVKVDGRAADGGGGRVPWSGRANFDPAARGDGIYAVAAALARRGNLWHADQSLSPPDPQPGANPGSGRRRRRNRQLSPRPEKL